MLRSLVRRINSLIMALLLAVVVWSVATSESNPSREGLYPEALPIEIVNVPDGLTVYQRTTATVKVKIRAPQAGWDQLSARSFSIKADLNGLSAGLHQVELKYQVVGPQVSIVSIEPSAVGIRLEPSRVRTFDVRSDILDTVPQGFTAKPPVVSPAQVTVSGAGILVDQVTEVVADVFLRGAKSPFEREVTLIAHDAAGNVVQGVTITPAVVLVNVQMEQRVGYKDVSIKAVLKGAPQSGYWVSNVVVDPSTATIVGSADVLAKIPGYVETVPVDVTGATADVNKRVALALPDNVSALNSEGANIRVSVTPLLGGQTVRRNVVVQGLRRGLSASVSPAQVDVILSGPLPTLAGLLPDDVPVVVDASGLTAGTFQVRPRVSVVPDSLKVGSIVPDSVQLTVVDLASSTPPTPSTTVTVAGTVGAGLPASITLPARTGTPGLPGPTATGTLTATLPVRTQTATRTATP